MPDFLSLSFGPGPSRLEPRPGIARHLRTSRGGHVVQLQIPVCGDQRTHALRRTPQRPLLLMGRPQYFPDGTPKMIPARVDIGELKAITNDPITILDKEGRPQKFALTVYAVVSIRPWVTPSLSEEDDTPPASFIGTFYDDDGKAICEDPTDSISTSGDFTPSRDGRTRVPGFAIGGPTDQPNPNLAPPPRPSRPSRSTSASLTSASLAAGADAILLSEFHKEHALLQSSLSAGKITEEAFNSQLLSLRRSLEACGLPDPLQ